MPPISPKLEIEYVTSFKSASGYVTKFFKSDMEAFIPRKKGCLLDCLDWVPNLGAYIDAYLICDVTRSFWLHDIKALSKPEVVKNSNLVYR